MPEIKKIVVIGGKKFTVTEEMLNGGVVAAQNYSTQYRARIPNVLATIATSYVKDKLAKKTQSIAGIPLKVDSGLGSKKTNPELLRPLMPIYNHFLKIFQEKLNT